MIEYFGFSSEVATLTISLWVESSVERLDECRRVCRFVAGYCVGPLLWGPMSESYGRKPIFVIAFFAYTGFQVSRRMRSDRLELTLAFAGWLRTVQEHRLHPGIPIPWWTLRRLPREHLAAMASIIEADSWGPSLIADQCWRGESYAQDLRNTDLNRRGSSLPTSGMPTGAVSPWLYSLSWVWHCFLEEYPKLKLPTSTGAVCRTCTGVNRLESLARTKLTRSAALQTHRRRLHRHQRHQLAMDIL